MSEHDWSKYVGIPFKDRGRNFDGVDCYGLVRLALEEEYGVLLPALLSEYEDPLDHESVGSAVAQWLPLLTGSRLPSPEEGSVAVIKVCGYPCHLGLYIGDGLILHARSRKTGSVFHRVTDPFFTGRIAGYYRVY